jgi:hypothetical protein
MANTRSAGTITGPATGSPPPVPGQRAGRRPAGPAPAAGRRNRRAWPTPTRLWGALLAVVAVVVLLTAAAALTVQSEAGSARQTSGPVEAQAVNVQELYYALSDADAAAATGILDSPAPPTRFTQRYQTDITDADDALAASTVDTAGDQQDYAQLQHVTEELSEYTGLIGLAQADNRQNLTVGGAYLREASNLLENTMLPSVKSVLADQTEARSASASDSGGVAYWPLGAAVLVLIAGIWAWRLLAERTRRRVNAGLAVALLGALILVGWTVAASARAGGDMSTASTDFTHVAAAQQARGDVAQIAADEAASIVSQGADNGAAAGRGKAALGDLGTQLTIVEAAEPNAKSGDQALLGKVRTDVGTIQGFANTGDYADATPAMVGDSSAATAGGAQADLDKLAASLAGSEQDFQSVYQHDSSAAVGDYPGGPWPIVLVGLLAAAAAGLGINRRIAEYR